MEEYKQALIDRIQELQRENSRFSRSSIIILLKLLSEVQKQE